MEVKLKQRIIGAIVLIVSAIIVLPILLDGSAEHRTKVKATIPAPPMIDIKPLTVHAIRQQMDAMVAASESQLPSLQADNSELPKTPFSLNNNGLPVSWSLQLGSFRNQGNAIKLRQMLRDAKQRSYILVAASPPGEVYRVFVGPMLDKSMLQAVAADIESQFDLKGQIIRYRIEEDRHQLDG